MRLGAHHDEFSDEQVPKAGKRLPAFLVSVYLTNRIRGS